MMINLAIRAPIMWAKSQFLIQPLQRFMHRATCVELGECGVNIFMPAQTGGTKGPVETVHSLSPIQSGCRTGAMFFFFQLP